MRYVDTAIINVPLSKRGGGSLDAQIDRHLREQAADHRRAARVAAAQRRSDKAEAKALLAKHLPAILAQHGPKLGEKALRDMLDDLAKWQPAKLIAIVNKIA